METVEKNDVSATEDVAHDDSTPRSTSHTPLNIRNLFATSYLTSSHAAAGDKSENRRTPQNNRRIIESKEPLTNFKWLLI